MAADICYQLPCKLVYNGLTSHGAQKIMTYRDVSIRVTVSLTMRNLSIVGRVSMSPTGAPNQLLHSCFPLPWSWFQFPALPYVSGVVSSLSSVLQVFFSKFSVFSPSSRNLHLPSQAVFPGQFESFPVSIRLHHFCSSQFSLRAEVRIINSAPIN